MMEEKENVTQMEIAEMPAVEQGAEAQKEVGSKTTGEFGKFQSADALLQAYNSLQAEFTRRSQRLKELEKSTAQNNPNSVQTAMESTPMPENNGFVAQSLPASAPETEEQLFSRANASQTVKTRIIEEYLAGVKQNAVPLMGAGVAVTSSTTRAKNVAEAGQMALGYFKTTR